MERIAQYERDFEQFRAESPGWEDVMDDSLCYELQVWYDGHYMKEGGAGASPSMAAVAFAEYVMNVRRCSSVRRMTVCGHEGGRYALTDMSGDELRSLLVMIKGAGLEERRVFNGVKMQIERILSSEGVNAVHVACKDTVVQLKPGAILKRRLKREEFNKRVWNTFEQLNIETLGDILQVSEKFYLSLPNFGQGSLNVIRLYVKKYGYELKEK